MPYQNSRGFVYRRLLNLILILGLISCGVTQLNSKVEHGFSLANVGTSKISDVEIKYGQVVQYFCKPYCLPKRESGGWFAPMQIQDEMVVKWITMDGISHEEKVAVKSRIINIDRFRRLFLEFDGDVLVVKQGANFAKPSAAGWEESPLFP